MPSSPVPRLRLLALCLAVACRVAIFAIVTVLAIRSLQSGVYGTYRPNTLAIWLALCSIPAVLLVPLIGPIASSRWNRGALIGSSVLLLAVLSWAAVQEDVPWVSVAGLLSLEAAFFGSTALAILGRWATKRELVLSVFLLSLFAAVAAWLVNSRDGGAFLMKPTSLPILAAVSTLCLCALRSDAGLPLSLSGGVLRPFREGVREVFTGHIRGRSSLVGSWFWFFGLLVVLIALVRLPADTVQAEFAATDWGILVHPTLVRFLTLRFLTAFVFGVAFSGVFRHPYRRASFVFVAAVLAATSAIWLRFNESSEWPLLGLGFALGLAISPLTSFYLTWTTPKYHGVAASLIVGGWCLAALAVAGILLALGDDPTAARTTWLNILVGVTAVAMVGSTVSFLRPALEVIADTVLTICYDVKVFGPGLKTLPARGTHLVIANHAAWFDPLYLAKFLPAPINPMMTSKFYDLPVVSWLMRHVIETIRVEEKPYRHEAPELAEAVKALDAGKCVILFPEGYLRRKEEQPLRRFGRGVWRILSDRPSTPVFACWIEGNWGSYFSYKGGPPTKGKRFDFRRKIRIGVIGPITLDPEILKDHMATRTYLMRQVAAAREPLGLPPLDLPAATAEGEKE